MKITINGETKEFREGITVSTLLAEIGTAPIGVAVECNREIIPRSQHSKTALNDGDVLEIVKMVGGG